MYYLLHGLVVAAFARIAARALGTVPGWLVCTATPAVFAASLLPAAALFLWVERPVSLAPRPARAALP